MYGIYIGKLDRLSLWVVLYAEYLILRRMVLFSDGATEGKHKVRFLSSRFAIMLRIKFCIEWYYFQRLLSDKKI